MLRDRMSVSPRLVNDRDTRFGAGIDIYRVIPCAAG